ncbi:MAG: DUF1648 domain-containing protein [Chloroflexi bacterium]|jgi:hypothetical protein|nr:DUF1648 domain-containing protein [Chloroflexota bacterium]
MNKKLVHPLWTHLPGFLVLAVVIGYLISALPLPDEAPIHFNFNGIPDDYSSPWIVVGIVVGLSLMYISISIIIDELWARQEKQKSFNWFAPFDDITVGLLGGVFIGYIRKIDTLDFTFDFPWLEVLLMVGLALILAVITERARPYRPYEEHLEIEDVSGLESELAKRLRTGQKIAYWENQDPAYMRLLSVLLPLIMFGGAVANWASDTTASILLLVLGLLFPAFFGGMRVLVTRDTLKVKLGVLGIPLVRLNISDIDEAEVFSFSPLRDFGGYGIRMNRRMKGYFFGETKVSKLLPETRRSR